TGDRNGLNVHSDNTAAIRVYEKIGFEIVGTYHEWMVTRK
ncbi:MAG: GNAT family N-acetyltransferase, partial [Anaerolineales bacterium]